MAITEHQQTPRILVAGCGKLGGAIASQLTGTAQVYGLRRSPDKVPEGIQALGADPYLGALDCDELLAAIMQEGEPMSHSELEECLQALTGVAVGDVYDVLPPQVEAIRIVDWTAPVPSASGCEKETCAVRGAGRFSSRPSSWNHARKRRRAVRSARGL